MNKNIKILLISVLMFIAMAIFNSGVQAASGELSANSTSVNVGEKVTITVTVNGASWNLNLSGAVEGSYVDVTDDGENTTKTFTKTFTPSSEGSFDVNLNGTVTDTDMTKVTIDKKITIKATKKEEPETPPAKSNNANLKNLGIRPNDFKGFKSGTTSYDVKVPNSVDKIEVYAVKADEKATVSGTGSKSLNVGKNVLTVEVTAEDGTKKTYTINVTREEKTEITNNTTNETSNEVANVTTNETTNEIANNIESEPTVTNSDLVSLSVEGYTLTPSFSPSVYEYKLNLSSTDVTELTVLAKGANDNVKIDIVGNTDLKDGENIITILVKNTVTNENSTYQIIVNKNNVDLDEVNSILGKNTEKVNIIRGILLGIIVFIVVCTIAFVVIRYKKIQQIKNDYKYEYEEDEDDEGIIEKPKAISNLNEEIKEEVKDKERINDETFRNKEKTNENVDTKDVSNEDSNWKRNKRNGGKGKHF